MTNTSANPITVNGIRLDTLAYNIQTKSGIVHMAGVRGANDIVPGRNGAPYQAGKRREEGRIILRMWAQDGDVNGVPGADRYATWRANMDMLLMLFDTSRAQVLVQEAVSATETRQALCEVRGPIDPEIYGRVFAALTVELIINETFWTSTADSEFISPTGASAVATHSLPTFLGSTAPMEDLWVVVDGPLSNAQIVDVSSGHVLRYDWVLSSGNQWVVNTSTWESVAGSGLNYSTAGGISVTDKTTSYGPYAPRLFALSAGSVASQVALSGTASGGLTRLRIKGKKKFH